MLYASLVAGIAFVIVSLVLGNPTTLLKGVKPRTGREIAVAALAIVGVVAVVLVGVAIAMNRKLV
jgi:hypothetical protein